MGTSNQTLIQSCRNNR